MAEAVSLTLTGNEVAALELLKAIGTNNEGTAAFVRALQTRNTGDYRMLDKAEQRTPIESIEWFSSMADYADTPSAWKKLSLSQQSTIDYARAAGQLDYSVEMGHQLLAIAIPSELAEIKNIYELSHPTERTPPTLAKTLNELPERCFSAESGKARVHVIGWGQWAAFFQRHLCQAIRHNFYFMERKWGVPDEAKKFASQCDREFSGLRYYPFVKRFTCTDVKAYHQSVDEGFKVTVNTPQLTPAECWNYLCYKGPGGDRYRPNPNPHVNEWHNHNPPPGTVYDLYPRLDHPSLVERSDAVVRFEQLHEMAPYDCRIANFLVAKKYKDHPTYEQAKALYEAMLPYSVVALTKVAATVDDKPEQYEKIMLQIGALNPAYYCDLGDYLQAHGQLDKGAEYIEKACEEDADAVRTANRAVWRVNYYLGKGDKEKARKIADEAAEVYSARGLEAKATFMEATSNYDGAFDCFAKIEERYGDSDSILYFCLRYKSQTGDDRFEPEIKKRLPKWFPGGGGKGILESFQGPPKDGVIIKEENAVVRANGLRSRGMSLWLFTGCGRIICGNNMFTGRELKKTPELDLIVWARRRAYREFKSNPPNHRFGGDFGDYTPKR